MAASQIGCLSLLACHRSQQAAIRPTHSLSPSTICQYCYLQSLPNASPPRLAAISHIAVSSHSLDLPLLNTYCSILDAADQPPYCRSTLGERFRDLTQSRTVTKWRSVKRNSDASRQWRI